MLPPGVAPTLQHVEFTAPIEGDMLLHHYEEAYTQDKSEQVLSKKTTAFKPPQLKQLHPAGVKGVLWPNAGRRVVHAPPVRTSRGLLTMPDLVSALNRAKVITGVRGKASPRDLQVTRAKGFPTPFPVSPSPSLGENQVGSDHTNFDNGFDPGSSKPPRRGLASGICSFLGQVCD